jgi:hypothetical protein
MKFSFKIMKFFFISRQNSKNDINHVTMRHHDQLFSFVATKPTCTFVIPRRYDAIADFFLNNDIAHFSLMSRFNQSNC